MKLIVLALFIACVLAQNSNTACEEGQKATHHTVSIGGSDQCLDQRALNNLSKIRTMIDNNVVLSVNDAGTEVTATVSLGETTNCGDGSEACIIDDLYSVALFKFDGTTSIKAEGATFALSDETIVFDMTKRNDDTWCTGDVDITRTCTIVAKYSFKNIDKGHFYTKNIVVKLDKVQSGNLTGTTSTDLDFGASTGATGTAGGFILYDPETEITRMNSEFNAAETTPVKVGDSVHLRLKLKNLQSGDPIKKGDATVVLQTAAEDKNIDIKTQCTLLETSLEGGANHSLDVSCPIWYIGTYVVKIQTNNSPPPL